MSLSIETVHTINHIDVESAAAITAQGFGRDNDEHNYQDTFTHLASADYIQLVHDQERLVAFAAYRRLLWQPCH